MTVSYLLLWKATRCNLTDHCGRNATWNHWLVCLAPGGRVRTRLGVGAVDAAKSCMPSSISAERGQFYTQPPFSLCFYHVKRAIASCISLGSVLSSFCTETNPQLARNQKG